MAKKLKRAFTIVELVIVIAVIAILAAVLIPTFTTLIDKANQSADTSNVKNMNSILAMDETTNGKPKTMDDAVKVIREGGYDLEKLTPTGRGYDIVWDQDANRLLMVNGNEVIFGETEKNANEKHLWVVVDSVEKIAATGYSVYLTDVFKGTVEAKQGVDVGSNEDITTVTYNPTEKQDVKIRTNGGALEVNAAAATVSHYDAAASVDIQAVADHSYHEYGTVAGNITLKQGRFVAEDNSSATAVVVTATDVNAVEIVINDTTKTWSIAAENETVAGGLKDIVSGNTANADIAENPVVSGFAGGLGTESNPYLVANLDQFRNITSGNDNAKIYYKILSDLVFTDGYVADSLYGAPTEYWAVYQSSGWLSNVVIEGNDKKLTIQGDQNAPGQLFIFNGLRNAELIDINVEFSSNYSCYINTLGENVTYQNVDVYGGGGHNACYSMYMYSGENYFIDCDSYADINNNDQYTAVFVMQAGASSANYECVFNFINCTYNATFVSPQAGMFLSNTYGASKKVLNVTNCSNNGLIQSLEPDTTTNNFIAMSCTSNVTLTVDGKSVVCDGNALLNSGRNFISQKDLTFSAEISNDKVFITKATDNEVAYYVVYLGIYGTSDEGSSRQTTAVVKVDNDFEGKLEVENSYFEFVCGDSYNETGKTTYDGTKIVADQDGNEYILYNGNNEYFISNPSKPGYGYVIAYDINGQILYLSTII